MGLIKAAVDAAKGVIADQYKEYFTCNSLPSDVMMVKGMKQSGKRSANRGSDNLITSGSGIVVADGQCMIIVDQGEIVEVCAEPGVFTYDASKEPTIFCGDIEKGIVESFEIFKKRFAHGGVTGTDQRVYYFNTKEMTDNKFGTPSPIPFRVVDTNVGLDIDMQVRCSGIYSFKIADPILFYKNVAGNVNGAYTVDMLASQLKTEFVSALQPAFGKLSELGLRPNALASHVDELCASMNELLDEKWGKLRGLEVVSIAMNPITLSEEDQEILKTAQKSAVLRDPGMAAATLTQAQADAMKAAAGNAAGAMTGFMGLGMAQQAGGINAQSLFEMGQAKAQQPAGGWQCSCGQVNTGNFCSNCGTKKPEAGGKFCSNCGAKLDGGNFCPECGTKVE